ncbi:MAG: DUF2203 domain-containing protein [Gammaproteobacteria bacterium]|nr:DUF2203 domain-containing protein [Gammaproteobacteria bacterium]
MIYAEIHQITTCDDPRVFTLAEAEGLFPLVRKITQGTYHQLEPVRRVLEAMVPTNPTIKEIERQYEAIVKRWVGKMERLGLVVKGLWLVDFDTGDGYLCWKFPELRIGYYHGYHEGYSGRVPLQKVVEELDPDWAHA